ncbi:CNH domain-containing protein [Lipomyces chichibuensis]|uniref:CNH domain-containing protein n=1 Tax=Lipomyces chichibuensis TaxID=1546026 RepID=UPI003343BBB4
MSRDGFNNIYYNIHSEPAPRVPPRPPPHPLRASRTAMQVNNDIPPALPPKVPLNGSSSSREYSRAEFSSSPVPDWEQFNRYGGILGTASLSTPAFSVDGNPVASNPSMHPRRDVFDRFLEVPTVDYSNISIFSESPPQSEYYYDENNSYSSQQDLGYENPVRRPDMEPTTGPIQRMSSPVRTPPVPVEVLLSRGSPANIPQSRPPVPPPHETSSSQSPTSIRYPTSRDTSQMSPTAETQSSYRRNNVYTFSSHMMNKSIAQPNTRPPLPHEFIRAADSKSTLQQVLQRQPDIARHQIPRFLVPDNLSSSRVYQSQDASTVVQGESHPAGPYIPSDYFEKNSVAVPNFKHVSLPLSPTGSGLRSGSNSPSWSPVRDEQFPERSSPVTYGDISPFSTTFGSTGVTEPSDNSGAGTPSPNVTRIYSSLNLLANVGYNLDTEDGLHVEIYSPGNSPVPPQHGVPLEDESDHHEAGNDDRFAFDNRSYSQSSDAFSYSTSEPRSPEESGTSTPPKPPQHFTPYGSILYSERADADSSRPQGLQKWSSWSSMGGVKRTDLNALSIGPQPVRANTTGRVPLEADGNLRSQQRQVSQPWQQQPRVPQYQEYRVQLQDNEYLPDFSGDEDTFGVPEDESGVYLQATEEELDFAENTPTEPLRLCSTLNIHPTITVESSRPQSPAESATSTHADTGVMMRLGLPTELPDSSPNLSSQAPSEPQQHGTGQSTLQISFGKRTLSSLDYSSCKQSWLLSELYRWVRRVMAREANLMRETELIELIRGLFTHWIPTLRSSTADENASAAIASFILHGVMDKPDAIHVRVPQEYEPGYVTRLAAFSGVLAELAGRGCYSTHIHSEEEPIAWRCYSPKCSRTLRSRPKAVPEVSKDFLNANDWSGTVPISVLNSLPKREITRQSVIFEIIQGEHKYLAELRMFVANFRDKPVAKDLCAATEELLRINTEYLYGPLLVRQAANPIMDGIGDIFHEWLLSVQKAYELYASIVQDAKRQYELEAARDPAFQQFDKDYKHQSRDKYEVVWLRLVRYRIFLERIRDETDPPIHERQKVKELADKIHGLILAFQARLVEGEQRYALMDLEKTIKFTDKRLEVNLYLNQKSRQLIHQGRMEVKVEGHMRHSRYLILLDNYLLIANVSTGSRPTFEIVNHPIPIDLLVLMSNNDPRGNARFHIAKSQANLAALRNNRSSMPQSAEEPKEKAQPMLNTKDSETDKLYPFRIEHLGRKGTRYTFYVASENDRREWCKCIEKAKRGFAIRMQSFRAEPFSLEVISDLAFGYGSEDKAPEIPVQSTVGVVERALRNAESDMGDAAKQSLHVLINSRVNCAATFCADDLGAHTLVNRTMNAYLPTSARKPYTLVGCDWGVYLSDGSSPRSWVPILGLTKVKQIHILPEFGIAVMLANKALLSYDLEALLAAKPMEIAGVSPTMHPSKRVEEWLARRETQHEKILITPHQISRHEFTGFSVGVLRGRTIIVGYKSDSSILGSADDIVTTLKIFEPIAGKLSDFSESDLNLDDDYVRLDRVLLMRRDVNGTGRSLATVDIAHETDSVAIQKQISGITVLKKSIVLHNGQGFEIMPVPTRSTVHIPVPDSTNNDFLRKLPKTGKVKPLGIFRIGQQEFLLCYSTYCIFCDKYGQVSRSAYIKFECTARAVAFSKPYIVAFDHNFVEVRSVDSGEKKQIIIAVDVRLLRSQVYHDDPDNEKHGYVNVTGRTGNDIIFSLAHPEVRGRQLLMKLKLNDEAI